MNLSFRILLPVVAFGYACSSDPSGVPGPLTSDAGAEADGAVPVDAAFDGGSASGPDAGRTDASGDVGKADAGVDAGPKGVPSFVAIGYQGRSTVSCDDGKTWKANRSDDDSQRCFDPTDCDHNGKAGRGLAFGNGWFVANFGWGQPGTIRRSRDGVAWDNVHMGSNFGSMMFGAGRFVGAARSGKLSVNDGATWTDAAPAELKFNGQDQWNVRRGAFAGSGFLLIADGPSAAFGKDGTSWTYLSSLPTTCGKDVQWAGGIAFGNGAIVVVSGDGVACRSANEGASWTTANLGGTGLGGRLVFTGSEFMMWGAGSVYRSTDGTSWTSTPTKRTIAGTPAAGAGPNIGAVARSPRGTFVAVNDGWQQWYEKQHFYRSTDGVTWDELPAGTFAPSHPMTQITWGEATVSSCTP
jgi:hypothetical protein